MAWLDDRAWCHPKLVNLSDRAWRVYFSGVSYSAGMGTKGVLTLQQQRLVGSGSKVREELVHAGLWDEQDTSVAIHDWDLHNGKRDERRVKDRERKKSARASAGQSPRRSRGASAGTAHVEGSEGSEGREPNGSLAKARERNPVWDALVDVFGEPSTDTARTLRGKVCSSLTRAGATPEEVMRRAKSWPRHFDHATLTETALEKHWDALGRAPMRVER